MTTVGQSTLTCPNCGHDFDTKMLYSTSYGGLTSEFRRVSIGAPPEPYRVHTCTHCGLSGWDTVFETGVSPGTAALVAEHVTRLVTDGPPEAWRRYEFAAWIAEWEGSADEDVAYLYMCAAWCADDESLPGQQTARYRRDAIDSFRRALDGDQLEAEQRAELTYLVGELYRRVGDAAAADEWLGRVAGLVEADETGGRLTALAQRQRTEPSEVI